MMQYYVYKVLKWIVNTLRFRLFTSPEEAEKKEMMKKMFGDLLVFLTLLSVIMMGFATAFHHLFHSMNAYSTWSKTWITLLSNLIGESLQFDNFETLDNVTLANLGKMLLVVYLLLSTVLLLNLLIAAMSVTYEETDAVAKLEFRIAFARRVLLYEELAQVGGRIVGPCALLDVRERARVRGNALVEDDCRPWHVWCPADSSFTAVRFV